MKLLMHYKCYLRELFFIFGIMLTHGPLLAMQFDPLDLDDDPCAASTREPGGGTSGAFANVPVPNIGFKLGQISKSEGKREIARSPLLWLTLEIHLGNVPIITPSMLLFFGPEEFNVGCVVTLGENEQREKRIAIREELMPKRPADNIPLGQLTPEQLEIKIALGNIEGREQEMTFARSFYREKNISFLDYPSKINLETIKDVVRVSRLFLDKGQSVIIVDYVNTEASVTLFTCYLMSIGWSKKSALAQARHGRLEYQDLQPFYMRLIEQFEQLVRS